MNKPNTTPKVKLIKLSADVHRKDFKICRQVGDQNLQPAQVFDPAAAVQWALKQLASAERVVVMAGLGAVEAKPRPATRTRRRRAAGDLSATAG